MYICTSVEKARINNKEVSQRNIAQMVNKNVSTV